STRSAPSSRTSWRATCTCSLPTTRAVPWPRWRATRRAATAPSTRSPNWSRGRWARTAWQPEPPRRIRRRSTAARASPLPFRPGETPQGKGGTMEVTASRQWMQALLATTLLALGIGCDAAGPGAAQAPVRANQLGYPPAARKLVVVETSAPARFRVVAEGRDEPLLQGQLQPAGHWEPAARDVGLADLSALATPDRYRLLVDGMAPSDAIVVDAGAYAGVAMGALKGFYFHRASTPLARGHAGRWARKAGHPDDKVLVHASAASPGRKAGSRITAPRGWYDAGDYGKYVVNSGITLWTLLAAWEHYPEFFRGRDAGIPESGDAVPDILDEALWNLQGMLAMQDPADGGVYHK